MAAFATLYTYPWDLQDEGVDRALDAIVKRTGVTSISLAVSYHVSTYFLPHNPRRKLYYGEDGAVYFHPDPSLYADSDLKPRISEVVTGPDYLPELVDRIRKRGLGFAAWVVYGYNHHLAGRFPDAAKQNAFGDVNLAQLSPSSPAYRAYALALTKDVVTHLKPDEVHLESLSYLSFTYGFRNPKVLGEIGPFDAFLMGLCFNRHSVAAAAETGLDAEELKKDVAAYLAESLARRPDESARRTPGEASIMEAFGGRLGRYLAVLTERATTLFESAASIVREAEAKTSHNWPRAAHVTGLDLRRTLASLDRASIPAGDEPDPSARVADHRRELGEGKRVVADIQPDAFPTGEALAARLRVLKDAGVDGYTVYNYGLLRNEQLEWVGACRRLWS